MTAIHETAYPRMKPVFSAKELKKLFAPTEDEMVLLNKSTRKTRLIPRLGFMVILKYYQYLGRPVRVIKISESIKKTIADTLGIDHQIDLKGYDQSTRKRHIRIIRHFLQINADKKARRKVIKVAALEAANTRENLADIINVIIEELIKERFELPAFKKLLRLARAARTVVNNGNYQHIVSSLSIDQKKLVDGILGLTPAADNSEILSWAMLKLEPKKPTTNNIKDYIRYVNTMLKLRQQFDLSLDFIAPARLEQLKDEAMVTDVADMKKMRPLKRNALVIILIIMKAGAAVDDLVQIFITWIRNIETQAKTKLEEYRLKQADKTDNYVLLLYKTLLTLKSDRTAENKIQAIEDQFGGKTDALLEQCREYLGLTGENHLQWMMKPYRNKRSVIFQLLDQLRIFSSNQDKSVETALRFIGQYRHSHQEWIDLENLPSAMQPDLNLLSDGWFKAVTGLQRGKEIIVKKIHRHYYEIAVLEVLMGDLNCSDAYVDGALIYDNPNKQFITWEQFNAEVDPYCSLLKIDKNPEGFIQAAQVRLHKAAITVDENYQKNPFLVIENSLPILKKLPKRTEPPNLEKVRQLVMEKMPITSILDAIIDVENWLNLSVHFKPHSGNEIKIQDYPPRFVTTTLAYGCNIGPTQAERSVQLFTRKQIAWLFNHHVTEQKITKAIRWLINRYNEFSLPKHWGPGDSLSVDGTFWDMYQQNLLAAHHIRYGRYGGVGYYHVSDQYIALFSNFISCGAHESIYLLDGVVENDSDIQARKIHGDSWAQSEVLFGLASLLGIQIMPRIRQFKHLYYYKASAQDHYTNINDLFTEKSIDWKLIETHYHDMLRVAISIQKGKVKASTVLRRLCSKSRKNKLYFAFRELGRVERTIFLLNYINDADLRRTIHAATCKSEEFNQFIGWLRFGDGGVIGDNMRFNQRKIIKFNHLLANMLIFHTMVHQTKTINQLRNEGVEITDEMLAHFAPYWTEHYNRYGLFQLNMEKDTAEIEYDLVM